MITNEEEMQAALRWIEYWKSTRTVGQSWIGNEQAARKISQLRVQINDYRRRTPDTITQTPVVEPVESDVGQQPT